MKKSLAALSVASVLLLTACSSESKTVCDYEDVTSTSYAQLSVTLEDLTEIAASEAFVAGDTSEVNTWGAEARTTVNQLADNLKQEAALVADEEIADKYAIAESFLRENVGDLAGAAADSSSVEEYQAQVLALFADTEWSTQGEEGDAAFSEVDSYILEECKVS